MKRILITFALLLVAVQAWATFVGVGVGVGVGGGHWIDLKPALGISPTSHAFGNVSTSSKRTADFTVTNSGNATLTDLTFGAFSSAAFRNATSSTSPCGSTLAAKASCNKRVEFGPTSASSYTGTLVILSNQLDNLYASVTGTGKSSSVETLYASQTANSGYFNAYAMPVRYNSYKYAGQIVNAGQATHNVSKVVFYVEYIDGTISTYNYNAVIYSRTGDNLNTLKGTSETIAGSSISTGEVTFTFTTPVSVAAGDVIAFTCDTASDPGFVRLGGGASDGDSGYSYYGVWESTKVLNNSYTGSDLYFKFYAKD